MSVLVDTQAAAVAIGRPAGTIRRWLHEGRLARAGQDAARRTLVDLAAVYALAGELRPAARRDTPIAG